MKKILPTFLSILFPRRGVAFDFDAISSEEILRTSPPAAALRTPPFPVRCRAVLSYKYPRTRALVRQIKYKKDRAAIHHGGYLLYDALSDLLKRSDFLEQYQGKNHLPVIIIPVPTSPARRRERGYNQCELLAQAMVAFQKETPLTAICAKLEVRTDILFCRATEGEQKFKNRNERLAGRRGIFAVHTKYAGIKGIEAKNLENADLKTTPVVILDDVLTTGSTLGEAIDTMRQAGFTDVRGLTLAH